MTKTKVVTITRALYDYWLLATDRIGGDYEYVEKLEDIVGHWGPIVVLNGGSTDNHIMNLVNHPSRRGLVARQEI